MDKIIKNKLSKMGYNIVSLLGSGNFGKAFLMSDGNVIKITNDENEANISSKLVGKKIQNVCNIYRVFKFKSRKYYFIVQEKLDRIKTSEDLINGYSHHDEEDLREFLSNKNFKKFIEDSDEYVNLKKIINNKNLFYILLFYTHPIKPRPSAHFIARCEDAARAAVSNMEVANKLYQIYDGIYQLKKLGIIAVDCHQDNIMQKNGVLKLVDISSLVDIKGNIESINEDFNIVDVIRKANEKFNDKGKYIDALIDFLNRKGTEYSWESCNVGDLKDNQKRVFSSKIKELRSKIKDPIDIFPIIVDKDYRILDGHHRAFVVKEKWGRDQTVPILRILKKAEGLIYESQQNSD